jgi:hypothetical protein
MLNEKEKHKTQGNVDEFFLKERLVLYDRLANRS